MDAAYLKQTVGPTLAKALASYIAHGGPLAGEEAELATQHAVEYVGAYLLHHDAQRAQIAGAEAGLAGLRKVKEAMRAAQADSKRAEEEAKARVQRALLQKQEAEATAAAAVAADPGAREEDEPPAEAEGAEEGKTAE